MPHHELTLERVGLAEPLRRSALTVVPDPPPSRRRSVNRAPMCDAPRLFWTRSTFVTLRPAWIVVLLSPNGTMNGVCSSRAPTYPMLVAPARPVSLNAGFGSLMDLE